MAVAEAIFLHKARVQFSHDRVSKARKELEAAEADFKAATLAQKEFKNFIWSGTHE